nr:hypothetical protein [Tanacetum cinerariifolium]
MFALTVSTTEPKNIKEAMADSAWIEAMQKELHQFDRLQDEDQTVIRNKARLVAKGYAQKEVFLITYNPGSSGLQRFFRCAMFIYSFLYVIPCLYIRSLSVMLSRISFHVLYDRSFKTLCLLKYALMKRHDYDIASSLRRGAGVTDNVYDDREVGTEADLNNLKTILNVSPSPTTRKRYYCKTLFIKKDRDDILLVQVYVDDIIFESIKKSDEFEKMMHKRFQMILIGELTFFLASTLMEPNKELIKDAEAKDVDVHLYRLMIRSLMYLTASRPHNICCLCLCTVPSYTKDFTASCCEENLQILKSNMKRGFLGEQTPLFLTMLAIQAKEGKGLGHPSEPQPPPSSAQHIQEELILTIVSSTHQKTQTPRQALNEDTELPQTSVPIPNVSDEAVYEEWDDSVKRATTTAASLDAVQDSGKILKTQSTTMLNVTHPQGIGTGGSPSMSLQELTNLCTTLSDRVLALETDLRQTKKVYGTAYTKLIMKMKKWEKTVDSIQIVYI